MKLNRFLLIPTLILGFWAYGNAVSDVAAPTSTQLQPSKEQSQVAKQLAFLVDRTHYLQQPIDASISQRVLNMMVDDLDANHSLFLASDISEFQKQYGDNFAKRLLQGDLSAAFVVYDCYQKRVNAYYDYATTLLKNPLDLKQSDTFNTDREKAPFFESQQLQQAYWNQQVRTQLIALTLEREEEQAKNVRTLDKDTSAQADDVPAALPPVEKLTKRYTRQQQYLNRQKNDRVVETVLNALLETYDPHSNYFAPVEAMEMNRQTNLALEGVGVSIRPDKSNDDFTRIETLVDGGPASKTGKVFAGDRIIGVAQSDGKMVDVVGWPVGELVGLIRGKRGTKVTLRLLATGASMAQVRDVTIVRDVIEEKEAGVQTRILNLTRGDRSYRIGVLDIPSFYLNYTARRTGAAYRSVSEDTAKALISLTQQGIDGLVVDLRNNPGGSLEEVSRMIGMFIKQGPVVQIHEASGETMVFRDSNDGELYTGPLAVMINLASASASEIFAAAIQDYQRGIVIGSTTTGKGTAQIQLSDLAYGQATLTQKKFYRITGGSTQNNGVEPDVKLFNIYDEDLGERKAKNALPWDTIKTTAFVREGETKSHIVALQAQSNARTVSNPQFQYLKSLKAIAQKDKNNKSVYLNIDQRRQEMKDVQIRTLAAENQRRAQTGLPAYTTWSDYLEQAEKENEARIKLPAGERPKLPEDEAFVTEASYILIDYAHKDVM